MLKNIKIVLVLVAIASGGLLHSTSAATLYESAMLGETGITNGGLSINSLQWIGSNFTLTTSANVTGVRGHIGSFGGTPMWAAIVETNGFTPTFDPSDIAANVLASAVFVAPFASDDVLVDLTVSLSPGNYALIFGSSSLLGGSDGGNFMPINGQDTAEGAGSYFFLSSNTGQWQYAPNDTGWRFVVEGTPIPVPASIVLMFSGLAGLIGLARRK